jgi:hypothetical protein
MGESWHHLIAPRHCQAAAGQKIVLHVHHQERIPSAQGDIPKEGRFKVCA